MRNLSDVDMQELDLAGMGSHITAGNEILTGTTLRDGQATGLDPRTLGSAACDYMQWIYDNTNYYCEIGTGFWKHSSYMYIRFFKKEDDSLIREWKSGAITGRANTSKTSAIHEILGVRLLSNICSYIAEI